MMRTQAIVFEMDRVLIDCEAFHAPAKRIANVRMFPLAAFFMSQLHATRNPSEGMNNSELLLRPPRGRSPVG